jgi:hypothetical protein
MGGERDVEGTEEPGGRRDGGTEGRGTGGQETGDGRQRFEKRSQVLRLRLTRQGLRRACSTQPQLQR